MPQLGFFKRYFIILFFVYNDGSWTQSYYMYHCLVIPFAPFVGAEVGSSGATLLQ